MKKILYIFILLLFPFFSKADAWDNLTKEQAEQVISYLQDNPYIFDYCDCCDSDGTYGANVFLMKVISAEIINCDWNDGQYSVKTKVLKIAEMPYSNSGLDLKHPKAMKEITDYTIFMNYTWVYDMDKQMATPFLSVIEYDYYGTQEQSSGTCRDYFEYPNPRIKSVKKGIKSKGYKKWFKEILKAEESLRSKS